jgi:glycosyltransferase involved in cell wall biosynthesis
MTIPLERAARIFLGRTVQFHEALVAHAMHLEGAGNDEKTLRWIRLTAELAWAAHTGRMSDERLEAIAVRIGQRLEPPMNRPVQETRDRGDARRHVLHVATTVIGTGGHTRLLENWIKADGTSTHSLLLVDQGQETIRATLTDRVISSGGNQTVLPRDATLLERARLLRQAAQSGDYDCIVLHHHPNDVVPLVAFATENCPPIGVMNHADHIFWLGVSIADLVVEFREFGAELSRTRRGVRQNFVFPLPLDIQSSTPARAEARARLNIPEAERVLVTIGSAGKYIPTERQRFFDTLSKVLDQHPDACLYAVGVSERDVGPLEISPHPRMKLLGVVPDPSNYQAAADLYLEGFPFGSYTALLETAARGIYPVLMHSPTAHNDMSDERTLRGLVQGPPDESGYIAEIGALLDDPEERNRRGSIIAQRIEANHGAEASRNYLRQVYDLLAELRHRVELLPDRDPRSERHDVDLAGFQSSRMRIPVADWISNKTLLQLTPGELLRLFALSVRSGDTRLAPRHAKSWLSVIKRVVLRS